MTDAEAVTVLGALAAEPYAWMQPGAAFVFERPAPRCDDGLPTPVRTRGVVRRRYHDEQTGVRIEVDWLERSPYTVTRWFCLSAWARADALIPPGQKNMFLLPDDAPTPAEEAPP